MSLDYSGQSDYSKRKACLAEEVSCRRTDFSRSLKALTNRLQPFRPNFQEGRLAVKLYMPSAFDHFKREGDIIGRLVVEYGELEWTLCVLASHVVEDFDLAVKTLYRSRGESQRINLADAMIRSRIPVKVKQTYEETLARLRTCLKIRNQ